jgi:hypothetical protein
MFAPGVVFTYEKASIVEALHVIKNVAKQGTPDKAGWTIQFASRFMQVGPACMSR